MVFNVTGAQARRAAIIGAVGTVCVIAVGSLGLVDRLGLTARLGATGAVALSTFGGIFISDLLVENFVM